MYGEHQYPNDVNETTQDIYPSDNQYSAQIDQFRRFPFGAPFGFPFGRPFGFPFGGPFGFPFGRPFGFPFGAPFGFPFGGFPFGFGRPFF